MRGDGGAGVLGVDELTSVADEAVATTAGADEEEEEEEVAGATSDGSSPQSETVTFFKGLSSRLVSTYEEVSAQLK